jgi:hypothetical protein
MEGPTLTRRATNLKRKSGSRLPKKSAKSASTTHRAPAFTSLRMTSNAWRAARLGLNPNEHGRKLAWRNGSHVLNIYGKIEVRSRAGASLFAMENDLLHRAL